MFFRALVPLFSSLPFLPLASAQTAAPFRFVAIGDTGSGSAGQRKVADQMWNWREKNPFQLVLMLGDNIYGELEFLGGGNPKFFPEKFDAFYQRFQEQGVVFHAVLGNHDMQTDHGQAEVDDQKRFGIMGSEGYYKFGSLDKFDLDGRPLVEFFAINSQLSTEHLAEQARWLQDQLRQSKATWKFVFMHEPIYSVSGPHAPDAPLRRMIMDGLKQYHVQFVLSGHNHFYARMKPVDGTMQLISGGGGRHLAMPGHDQCSDMVGRKYHFLSVEVFADKVRFMAIDENGSVFDDQVVDTGYLKTNTTGCPAR